MLAEFINDVQAHSTEKDPVEVAKKLRNMIKDYDANKPVPIVDIVKQMGFTIKIADKLPNDDSGVILIDPELSDLIGNNKCVLINGNIKYGKKRFVLAHEIGHYLFEFNSSENARFTHSFVRSYNKKSTEDLIEKKVNAFAAELLMPKDKFEEKYSAFKNDNTLSLADIIVKLSNFFETTIKSVETRIVELGL